MSSRRRRCPHDRLARRLMKCSAVLVFSGTACLMLRFLVEHEPAAQVLSKNDAPEVTLMGACILLGIIGLVVGGGRPVATKAASFVSLANLIVSMALCAYLSYETVDVSFKGCSNETKGATWKSFFCIFFTIASRFAAFLACYRLANMKKPKESPDETTTPDVAKEALTSEKEDLTKEDIIDTMNEKKITFVDSSSTTAAAAAAAAAAVSPPAKLSLCAKLIGRRRATKLQSDFVFLQIAIPVGAAVFVMSHFFATIVVDLDVDEHVCHHLFSRPRIYFGLMSASMTLMVGIAGNRRKWNKTGSTPRPPRSIHGDASALAALFAFCQFASTVANYPRTTDGRDSTPCCFASLTFTALLFLINFFAYCFAEIVKKIKKSDRLSKKPVDVIDGEKENEDEEKDDKEEDDDDDDDDDILSAETECRCRKPTGRDDEESVALADEEIVGQAVEDDVPLLRD